MSYVNKAQHIKESNACLRGSFVCLESEDKKRATPQHSPFTNRRGTQRNRSLFRSVPRPEGGGREGPELQRWKWVGVRISHLPSVDVCHLGTMTGTVFS